MNIYLLPFLMFSWATSSFCMVEEIEEPVQTNQIVCVATKYNPENLRFDEATQHLYYNVYSNYVDYNVQSPVLFSAIKNTFKDLELFPKPTVPGTKDELQALDDILSKNQEFNQKNVETILNLYLHLDNLALNG